MLFNVDPEKNKGTGKFYVLSLIKYFMTKSCLSYVNSLFYVAPAILQLPRIHPAIGFCVLTRYILGSCSMTDATHEIHSTQFCFLHIREA